jgi:hypothetical protein
VVFRITIRELFDAQQSCSVTPSSHPLSGDMNDADTGPISPGAQVLPCVAAVVGVVALAVGRGAVECCAGYVCCAG